MSCCYYQTLAPQVYNSPMMQYPTESLEDMYPETYRIVYPKVQKMCMMMDNPGNPHMYPYPTREAIESMTENIYQDCIREMGNPDEDEYEYETGDMRQFGFGPMGGFFGGFGRRRFLRDLIAILLIRQLLRRRRPF